MKNQLRSLAMASMLGLSALSSQTQAQTIYGLTNNDQIIWMNNVSTPSSVSGPYNINGMSSGQTMAAINFSPYDGKLYGLAYNAATTQAQLYTLAIDTSGSTTTFNASAVSTTTLSMNLGSGSSIGFNYVPTSNGQYANGLFRIVGTTGNNYMINASDGSIATTGTTTPSFAAGDINSGTAAAVGATAYTNNFYGSDIANEYGYDLNTNSIVKFDSTNWDSLHTIAPMGISLFLNSGVGMDTWYDTLTHSNQLFLAITSLTGSTTLYQVNEATGLATILGVVGSGSFQTRDIAVQRNNNISSTINGQLMYGLTLNQGNLISFDSYNPSTIRSVNSISGLASGQTMVAIATNPADRNLYGLGYNSSAKTYQLYKINTSNGAATAVNSTPYSLDLGSNANGNTSFNFNPTTGRIHVIGTSSTAANTNVELYPTTGAVASTDSSINYASGDINSGATANISSMAYTNAYNNAATSTALGVDNKTGALVTFQPNSNSSMNTMVSLTSIIDGVLGMSSNNNGYLDTYYDSSTATNIGYLATNAYGNGTATNNYSNFYRVDPGTGSTSKVGSVGPGTPVRSMAASKYYSGLPTYVSNVSYYNNNSLFVYPNPVLSQTRIVLSDPAASNVYVNVLDMNGRIVRSYEYSAGSYNLDLDMSNLPVGIYSARVSQNGMLPQNVKLVKE